ncbi:hypothetical protein niasHT_030393 [Heterodera trifolii]|uniref:Uncharacterized protein n=1 Tax=Heterodera trifolii TaxID=157864 RepID=A0ABD2KTE0_9BILA
MAPATQLSQTNAPTPVVEEGPNQNTNEDISKSPELFNKTIRVCYEALICSNELLLFFTIFQLYIFVVPYVRSADFGRNLSSVQLLLNKQDTFDNGLNTSEVKRFLVCSNKLMLFLYIFILPLVSSASVGENMAAVQELLKKHDTFEVDLQMHQQRSEKLWLQGEQVGDGMAWHTRGMARSVKNGFRFENPE